ncbi:MAG: TIGR03862 family flavoprotein [Xanthobacteraceae bacterium]|nr:MAG: TIGR03862 family flavoprotein [Xanthobacteraceae bacterium]
MPQPHRFHVAVIGAGPAGLMAAEAIAGAARVTVYDRMPSPGRKLMMAGRGGLNITHSEPLDRFLARYGEARPRLSRAIETFPPAALRAWCADLGQDTFVGSSGRVFPAALKASPLLRAWLRRLEASGVAFRLRHRWDGWSSDGALMMTGPAGPATVEADAVVLALGGASWPRLGSDGAWVHPLEAAGVAVAPLAPANCGFLVPWSDHFRSRCEGQPLKNIAFTFGGETVRGEAVIARGGIEGGAVYALSRVLREAIAADGAAVVDLDLRPDLTVRELVRRLSAPRGRKSLATFLRKAAGLTPVAIALLQETTIMTATPLAQRTADALALLIKAVPLRLTATAPLARAISTAGGVRFDEIGDDFMLLRRPGVFVAGEMLDWEAPTGGYLLQASFATGRAAGEGALRWLGRFK